MRRALAAKQIWVAVITIEELWTPSLLGQTTWLLESSQELELSWADCLDFKELPGMPWADHLIFIEFPVMKLSWADSLYFREFPGMKLSWADRMFF